MDIIMLEQRLLLVAERNIFTAQCSAEGRYAMVNRPSVYGLRYRVAKHLSAPMQSL